MGGALSKYDRQTKKVTVFPVPHHQRDRVRRRRGQKRQHLDGAVGLGQHREIRHAHQRVDHLSRRRRIPAQIRRLNVDAQNNIWCGHLLRRQASGQAGETGSDDRQDHRGHDPASERESVRRDPGSRGQHLERRCRRERRGAVEVQSEGLAFTLYPKPQATADTPKIQVTKDGAVWYSPRGSQDAPPFGVLYPDMNKIPTLGAYYPNGPRVSVQTLDFGAATDRAVADSLNLRGETWCETCG